MSNQFTEKEWLQLSNYSRIYFVGIGGISMSGLAEIAKADGHVVEGSDRSLSQRTEYLVRQGIPVHEGHRASWIDEFKPDLVVHTAAVHADNPELIRAREMQILTIDRATFLGWLNRGFQRVINIAGTQDRKSVV